MTFKHVKFGDSEMMRSFEKVAFEKGLAKPEVITKKASSIDLVATDDLMHNIVKLCAGLRQSGFDKYADELESNFLALKMSSSIYETSKETGEDLVDSAHPDGSHELENVDGDSLVETIIDQQLADLEMAKKNPTGKMSNAQAINSVRVVLEKKAILPLMVAPYVYYNFINMFFKSISLGIKRNVSILLDEMSKVDHKNKNPKIFERTRASVGVLVSATEKFESAEANLNITGIENYENILNSVSRVLNILIISTTAQSKSEADESVYSYISEKVVGNYFGDVAKAARVLDKSIKLAGARVSQLKVAASDKASTETKDKSQKYDPDTTSGAATVENPKEAEPSQKVGGPFSSLPIASDLMWAQGILGKEKIDLETFRAQISQNPSKLAYANNFIAAFQGLVNDLKLFQWSNAQGNSEDNTFENVIARSRYFKNIETIGNYPMIIAKFKTMKQKYDSYNWSS